MVICKFLLVNLATTANGERTFRLILNVKKGDMVTSEHHEPANSGFIMWLYCKPKRQAQIRFGLSVWRLKLPSKTKSVYATFINVPIQICKKP